jgi:formate hydrogenlyase subunit 6/NADH:ubiquinone oxidoreductase subunit I
MGALREYFAAIGRTVTTLGDGLAVTFSYLFRKPVTLQYPDRMEKPVVALLPERSRGILEVDLDICNGCTMCQKTCPIDCIDIAVEKNAETKERALTRFDIDIGKCMFCGLCVEVCPNAAIRHSHEFEGAVSDPARLVLHFAAAPVAIKVIKKGEEPPAKPLGSVVRQLIKDGDDRGSASKGAS